jgi:hypothetical protein
MKRRVALAKTDVSEEGIAYVIRAKRNGELGTLGVTSNRGIGRFSQGPHGVTSQTTTKKSSVAFSPQANYTD